MSDPADALRLEPEDLDGHTLDELTDYLEHGRRPADPSIDGSPACQIALGALQRLRGLAGAYLEEEPAEQGTEQDWIGAVLSAIPLDARAGRRIPLPSDDPRIDAAVTEGAVRGLVRAIGDDVPGLLVGGVRIGDDRPAALLVDVALVHGTPLPAAVDELRRVLRQVLPDHLPFLPDPIDVRVIGLIEMPAIDELGADE